MTARAPAGAEVGLYVDLIAAVAIGDVVETRSGRRYGVLSVRVQTRGKRAGRQHLRCVVLEEDEVPLLLDADHVPATDVPRPRVVHRIRWYRRKRGSGAGGIVMR